MKINGLSLRRALYSSVPTKFATLYPVGLTDLIRAEGMPVSKSLERCLGNSIRMDVSGISLDGRDIGIGVGEHWGKFSRKWRNGGSDNLSNLIKSLPNKVSVWLLAMNAEIGILKVLVGYPGSFIARSSELYRRYKAVLGARHDHTASFENKNFYGGGCSREFTSKTIFRR